MQTHEHRKNTFHTHMCVPPSEHVSSCRDVYIFYQLFLDNCTHFKLHTILYLCIRIACATLYEMPFKGVMIHLEEPTLPFKMQLLIFEFLFNVTSQSDFD